jgi:hypothetical protein
VGNDEYATIHHDILARDRWIVDGYGSLSSTWEQLSAADTLVYIDLPILAHYWGVTKRLATGLFQNPRGSPENSPVFESTLDGYRVIWRCHRVRRSRGSIETGSPFDIARVDEGLSSICGG